MDKTSISRGACVFKERFHEDRSSPIVHVGGIQRVVGGKWRVEEDFRPRNRRGYFSGWLAVCRRGLQVREQVSAKVLQSFTQAPQSSIRDPCIGFVRFVLPEAAWWPILSSECIQPTGFNKKPVRSPSSGRRSAPLLAGGVVARGAAGR